MRQIVTTLILLIFFSLAGRSQETSARMILSDSLGYCEDIQYAAMQLIPLYYQDGNMDTANRLLSYWERHCGRDETIYRTKVLWAIDNGKFTDSLISSETIGFLDTYQRLYGDTIGESISDYYYYTPDFGLLKWYQSFTDSIALRASGYSDLSAEEKFFVQFYLHPTDSNYSELESAKLKNSKLTELYKYPVSGITSTWITQYSIQGGAWIPDDKLAILGNHPSLGLVAGITNNKMSVNLDFALRVGKSANEYKTVYMDSMYNTTNFTGVHIGLEVGRKVLNWHRHELTLFGGPAFEMIEVLSLDDSTDEASGTETSSVRSPSLQLGASYRLFLNKARFIGIGGRYHLLNFKNTGGTNLRGNAFSFTVEYGFGNNHWLNNRNNYLNERLPKN
ncbi:MAG: hypothetical protein IPH88_07230 [Bacteroidales bacterium]|nr:hypothetical protein [Bacteroidales bacterium]